jgi:hypothetical protein
MRSKALSTAMVKKKKWRAQVEIALFYKLNRAGISLNRG